tara:strand:+ start:616 stop:1611 length:996 start_codon:yes stop_codon:yes gene_type:complete
MSDKKNIIPFYLILKETRESKEIDLQSISDDTKISINHLELIEQGKFDAIPSTFLRLFIRTYAQYLNIDYKKILNDYEKEFNKKGKNIFKNINQSSNQTIPTNETRKLSTSIDLKKQNLKSNKIIFKESESTNETSKFNIKETYFYKPKKIFTIISAFISILSIYLLISYLNNSQLKTISNIQSIQNQDIKENSIKKEFTNKLLNENDFDDKKLIDTDSIILEFNIDIPYIFKIVTQEKTKLHIRYNDQNNISINECNIIAKKDTLLKYKKSNSIFFDLWSSKDVQIDIENNSISKYIGKSIEKKIGLEDVKIRGSFNPIEKLLYLKYYKH